MKNSKAKRPFLSGQQVDDMMEEQEARSRNTLRNSLTQVATSVGVAVYRFLNPDTESEERERLSVIDKLTRRGHSQSTFIPPKRKE